MNIPVQELLHNPMFTGGAGIGIVGGVVAGLRNVPKAIGTRLHYELTTSVIVNNDDPAFGWFKNWLEEHPYSQKSRNIQASVNPHLVDENGRNVSGLRYSPAPGDHFFFYKGKLIWLHRNREKQSQDVKTGEGRAQESITVRVLGRNKAILIDLCQEIESLAHAKRAQGFLDIYVSKWGHWGWIAKRKARGLESVILDGTTGYDLLKDIQEFQRRAEWYKEMGIPHRRGYLFYGVPGSGKSSLAQALAGELCSDIYMLSLADKNLTDSDLMNMMLKIPNGAVVLFEDVDAVFDAERKKTEDASTGVTFSGLLNALDGVAASEGTVLFMSTNHLERLDAALIRPGRADMKVEFKNASTIQLKNLFTRFHPGQTADAEQFAAAIGDRKISMAAAQEHLLRHKDSPQGALDDLSDLLNETAYTNQTGVQVVPAAIPCSAA